ncbi:MULTISPECIES: HAD family hydrolase [Tessaracoccus]|uniref:HAD family hydrolase n=1 Tax=Tessaracoccus TaxID=72763 RepID=UPI0011462A76|nr:MULTISPECIES: HAD-IA family hydrolase [Tessaracoccus]
MSVLGTFDAVIFDFDGTIADSVASMHRAYAVWAEEYGIELESLRQYTGRPAEAVARALVPADLAPAAGRRIDELEVSDVDGVVALPGASDAFAAIPSHLRAIATSCTTALLDARLGATGLPRPDVVVTRDQVERGKPAPDSFLLAAERLGVAPERCLVCEDAPAGVAAARAAGMPVLAVLTEHSAEELAADWAVGSLADVRFETVPEGVRVTLR